MAGNPQRSTAALTQHVPSGLRRQVKPKIKPSVIAVYASVFALIVAMVSIGYHEPQKTSTVANTANVGSSGQINQTSVDNVVATGVAANVAQAVNLPIATSVANLAVSASTKSELAQSSDVINTAKPQIIGSGPTNRFVTNYTVVAGDTVDSLSVKFSISKDTIKWANNLTSDTLAPDKVLQILPFDGVLYTVKSSDTIDSIATKYAVDKTRLILTNDLDVSGLVPDSKIVLPGGNLPINERPGYVAPVVVSTYNYAGQGSGFGGSTWNIGYGTPDGPYAHGNCTLYAYNRRIQLGLPVGSNWGNAVSWAANARRDGLTVNNSPSVGAIIQNGGYLGHVGIVESIKSNGDLSISEMNAYVSGGGYNIVSGRIIFAANASSYLFIH